MTSSDPSPLLPKSPPTPTRSRPCSRRRRRTAVALSQRQRNRRALGYSSSATARVLAPGAAEPATGARSGRRTDQRVHILPALPPAAPVPEVPPAPQPHDLSRIAQDLQIRKVQVEAVVAVARRGQHRPVHHPLPQGAHRRAERGGHPPHPGPGRQPPRAGRPQADDPQEHRRQGKLTDAAAQAILAADTQAARRPLPAVQAEEEALATEAREKGLEPLAVAIWNRDPAVANLARCCRAGRPREGASNTDDVLPGCKHILAEMVAEHADVRGPLRAFIWDTGLIVSRSGRDVARRERARSTSRTSTSRSRSRRSRRTASWRSTAARRRTSSASAIDDGRRDGQRDRRCTTSPSPTTRTATAARRSSTDALDRLVLPSLEREVRRELTERAQDHAVHRLRQEPAQPAAAAAAARQAGAGDRPRLPHRLQAGGARRDRQPARRRGHLPARPEAERSRGEAEARRTGPQAPGRSSPSATAPPAARRSNSSPS